jgi:tetratricopeptide (TPR) repeat protein
VRFGSPKLSRKLCSCCFAHLMPSSSKRSYGPEIKERVKTLLTALLECVVGERELGNGLTLKSVWAEDQRAVTIETTLKSLVLLAQPELKANTAAFKSAKAQTGEALLDLRDFVEIFVDHRVQKRGSDKWHFTLKLWDKDVQRNITQLDKLWESRRSPNAQPKPVLEVQAKPQPPRTSEDIEEKFPDTCLPESQKENCKKIVLMLPARSESVISPRWKEEVKTAREVIKKSDKNSNKYEFQDRGDISSSDLLQTLSDIKPYVLHICGRADGIAELVVGHSRQDVHDKNSGQLVCELFRLIRLNVQSIICVVLSGCLIEEQIREINYHIGVVIAIPEALKAELAVRFINGFYFFLSSEEVKVAYDSGMHQLNQWTLEKGLAVDPALLPRIFFRADEISRREWEKELSNCIKEMEIQPDNIELLKRKASLLKDLERIDELTEVHNKISELEPNKSENRVKQGDDLEELGDSEKACDAYTKALEIYDTYIENSKKDKEHYKVWWKKAKSLTRSGQYIEAAESYKQSLLLLPPSPDDYVICREYGSILETLKNHYESIELYRTSVCLQANYRVASYHRKQLYKKIHSKKDKNQRLSYDQNIEYL